MRKLLSLTLTALLIPQIAFGQATCPNGFNLVCQGAPSSGPTLAPTATPTPGQSGDNLPSVNTWVSNMKSFGLTHCNFLKDNTQTFDNHLAGTYYDAISVYRQIAQYTNDQTWASCAIAARDIYRDQYVLAGPPNGPSPQGGVPGYWNFTYGLRLDYLATADNTSKSAVNLLATNGAFAPDATPTSFTDNFFYSRETAYVIESYINQRSLGFAVRSRQALMVTQAYSHLTQWFGPSPTANYIRPFMVALTARSLIDDYEITGDARTIPALTAAADYMWANLWVPSSGAFEYTNVDTSQFPTDDPAYNSGGTELAPDLNLLIFPMYAWLWKVTGLTRFRDEADAIFTGGVVGADLNNPKRFNQNYTWSIKGRTYRLAR